MIHNSTQKGFTIIELLLVMAIFTIMSGIVLTNYRDYNTNALFANASEDIVLALRMAQVYGVGSKGNITKCGDSSFTCRYGVTFIKSDTEGDGFMVFVDVDDNKIFQENNLTGIEDDDDILIEIIKWKNNIKISELTCNANGTDFPCDAGLTITFERPNPDAQIADTVENSDYDSARITISSGTKNSIITITKPGQISLK